MSHRVDAVPELPPCPGALSRGLLLETEIHSLAPATVILGFWNNNRIYRLIDSDVETASGAATVESNIWGIGLSAGQQVEEA